MIFEGGGGVEELVSKRILFWLPKGASIFLFINVLPEFFFTVTSVAGFFFSNNRYKKIRVYESSTFMSNNCFNRLWKLRKKEVTLESKTSVRIEITQL